MTSDILKIICFCIAFTTNVPHTTGIIQYGEKSELGSRPYQVRLLKNDIFICGGSLIAPNIVITAAHCVTAIPTKREREKFKKSKVRAILKVYPRKGQPTPYDFSVIAGDIDAKADEPTEHFGFVEEIVIHPGYKYIREKIPKIKRYKTTLMNDVALIKLEEDVPCSPHHFPILLPWEDRPIPLYKAATPCVTSGWGETEKEGMSRFLMEVELEDLYSAEACYEELVTEWPKRKTSLKPKEGQICAGTAPDYKALICSGDSGGPLACRYKEDDTLRLFGVNSATPRSKCSDTLSVFVDVSYYSDWILDTMDNLGASEESCDHSYEL